MVVGETVETGDVALSSGDMSASGTWMSFIAAKRDASRVWRGTSCRVLSIPLYNQSQSWRWLLGLARALASPSYGTQPGSRQVRRNCALSQTGPRIQLALAKLTDGRVQSATSTPQPFEPVSSLSKRNVITYASSFAYSAIQITLKFYSSFRNSFTATTICPFLALHSYRDPYHQPSISALGLLEHTASPFTSVLSLLAYPLLSAG